jgi:hypothetical protein
MLVVVGLRVFTILSICMSRSPTAWSCQVSLAECSRSSFALTIVCKYVSLSSGEANDDRQWEVQVLSARFRAGVCPRCRVAEEGFQL